MKGVVLYGGECKGNNNVVRYRKRGWRRWACLVCHALVHSRDVFGHAIFHVERSEGGFSGTQGDYHAAAVTVHQDHCVWKGETTDHPGPG